MRTWRTLHPRRILHAPDAISVHGSFHQVSLEHGPSGQVLRTLPTGQLRPQKRGAIPSVADQNCDGMSLNNPYGRVPDPRQYPTELL